MENWRKCLLINTAKVVDAAKVIDSTQAKIALIVDESGVLLGCITDCDVRRAILHGVNMETSNVTEIMSLEPKTALQESSDFYMHQIMLNKNVCQLPVVDVNGVVQGLRILQEFDSSRTSRHNPVVLMAGGLGTRLRPLTDDCPKPLLKIGDKPILEIILENFIQQGFSDFYISVNYKAEMIERYFGDGSNYGVSIKYLKEKQKLGTAGALSLLPKGICEPIIVMNGDLLTKVNFIQLLEHHENNNSDATMCVREYRYQIPYGVVETKDWNIESLREKPTYSAFVNAGIYVLNSDVVADIPENQYFDMTDLFELNVKKQRSNLAFPIREYWIDVGRMEDFERANAEFCGV